MAVMNAASPAESHANRGRADALAGGVALVFAGALVFVLGFLFIESQYRPQGSDDLVVDGVEHVRFRQA